MESENENISGQLPGTLPQLTTPSEAQLHTSVNVSGGSFWDLSLKDAVDSLVDLANAWPFALLLVLYLLRHQFRSLIGRVLKLHGWGVDFEFGERVEKLVESRESPPQLMAVVEVSEESTDSPDKSRESIAVKPDTLPLPSPPTDTRERMERLLQLSPRAVVNEAYIDLDSKAKTVAAVFDISPPRLREVVDRMIKDGRLEASVKEYASELIELRNRAVHSSDVSIAVEDALRYWKLAENLGRELIALVDRIQGKYKYVYKEGPNNGFI